MKENQNRRKFIATTTRSVIGYSIASKLQSGASAFSAGNKSKVAVVINEKAISSRNICDTKQVALMVEKGLLTITGAPSAKDAWTSLGVSKSDVIGIKVNCNSWTFLLATHPDLVYAIADSISCIVPPNQIIIYERETSELERCGYRVNKTTSGVRCFGNNEGGGYHPKEELTRIVTDMCTKIINVPSLKTVGDVFGGSLFLKNHIGTLPDGDMPRCHGNAEFCSEVCARPSIKNKTILGVCDGLRGTYKPGVPWYWGGIIMSRDSIAGEVTALHIINERRSVEKEPPLPILPYIKKAETIYKLGNSNPANIETVRVVI